MPYSGNPTVARFKTDMQNLSNKMAVSFEENMVQQGEELAQNMRGAVPILSGTLRDSIRVKNVSQHFSNRTRVSVLVMAGGPTTTNRGYDYALATEFGTLKEKPEPFFYSSARLYGQQGRESARETMEKVVEENNRVRALRGENYSNAAHYGVEGFTRSVGGRGGATVIQSGGAGSRGPASVFRGRIRV